MGNLDIYNKYREAPAEALKTIKGGRLSGMTDINPMWRIKALTEQFGPCGEGWWYKTKERWTEQCGEEIAAFVTIELFYKVDDGFSYAVQGTGGAMLYVKEKNGLRVNDEAYKMATTDAISVACKQLGFAADIYWGTDRTKYSPDKPAYPPREEMIEAILQKYPAGSEHLDKLLKWMRAATLEEAQIAPIMAVYNKITSGGEK